MRKYLVVLWMLLLQVAPATAEVHVSIGINLGLYPHLVQVPGYPVYYAPRLDSNYFFYDGMYWVFQSDGWYASSWYNGPWWQVEPEEVPLYVLRIPVRYYRQPPMYFQGWQVNAPPRWGEHWGAGWAQHRSGWDRWDRRSVPAPAPLPIYQRNYSGDRYPGAEQQRTLYQQKYRYQPREPMVRQLIQAPRAPSAPAPVPRGTRDVAPERKPGPRSAQHANPPPPVRQSAPQSAPTPPRTPPRQEKNVQHPAQTQDRRQKGAAPTQHPTPEPKSRETGPQGKGTPHGTPHGTPQEAKRQQKPGQEKDRDNADNRGQNNGR